jgi:hypothetical protein
VWGFQEVHPPLWSCMVSYNLDLYGKSIRELKKLTNLERLNFYGSSRSRAQTQPLTGHVMKAMSELPLKKMYFDCVRIRATALRAMCNKSFKSLVHLELRGSNLHDTGLTRITNLVSLEVLMLEQANITQVGLTWINGLPKLKILNVSYCSRIKTIPPLDDPPFIRETGNGIHRNNRLIAGSSDISSKVEETRCVVLLYDMCGVRSSVFVTVVAGGTM